MRKDNETPLRWLMILIKTLPLNPEFINEFGIQWPDVAELVLKTNARIVFGAGSEYYGDGQPKSCCLRFRKQCAHYFRGCLRNSLRPPKTTLPLN
jgi:hypothetical protein